MQNIQKNNSIIQIYSQMQNSCLLNCISPKRDFLEYFWKFQTMFRISCDVQDQFQGSIAFHFNHSVKMWPFDQRHSKIWNSTTSSSSTISFHFFWNISEKQCRWKRASLFKELTSKQIPFIGSAFWSQNELRKNFKFYFNFGWNQFFQDQANFSRIQRFVCVVETWIWKHWKNVSTGRLKNLEIKSLCSSLIHNMREFREAFVSTCWRSLCTPFLLLSSRALQRFGV